MVKLKVSEATNTQLDWLVAKCEGKNGVLHDDGITRCIVIAAASGVYKGTWRPTVNWSQMGPIIEREKIATHWRITDAEGGGYWQAENLFTDTYGVIGTTQLIATARCYVMSKLGQEVEIPEELYG